VSVAEGTDVRRAREGGVLTLTIDRPEAGNALTVATRAELTELFEAASGDPTVRAVLLTATGARHFCTGADLRAQQGAPRPEGVPERIAGDIARGIRMSAQRLISAILDCEKPVIAAVNGTAAGMGVQVALACDFVLAAESARFIEVYVRRALVPDAGAAYLLPRLVGVHRAKELLMLGDDVSAQQAYDIGLVNRVVPAKSLPAEAAALAERLASGPTRVHALTKWLVNRSLDSGRAASFEDEAIAQDLNMHTADGQEGLASYVERRPTRYQGW
jgi:2-(1,2-epoxy-1,2-dihydrophenyl)acetyl-CoA isomerase